MFSAEPPPYDRDQPHRTGPLLVNHDLHQLGLGDNWAVVGRQQGRDLWGTDVTPGHGWSRALYAPECAWPRGARLCVVVQWFPDAVLRRATQGVQGLWDSRLDAVADALRGRGYVVERAGRAAVPGHDAQADLLVYRMEEGHPPPVRAAGAWGAVPKPREYRYPEVPPVERLRYLVHTAELPHVRQVWVRDLPSCLWPPGAALCARVQWRPEPGGGTRAVRQGLRGITAFADSAGLQVQLAEREPPPTAEVRDLLLHGDGPVGT
ncbi:hypothetical protein AB0D49_34440 [Streptomyces sp. NPDC048290]|uniref:hypothetical protein n=1 Tax=Streptomyces sp. NPDC048290 TaxID=3155811 RepID=UPI0034232D3E